MRFFFLALLTESVELKDMTCDLKTFFGGFLFIGIGHGTDVDAFCAATFRADQVMMMMFCFGKLIDIAGTAEDFMDNIKLGQQSEISIDCIEGYIRLLLADGFTNLLGGWKGTAVGKSLQDCAALRCYLIPPGAKSVKGRSFLCHRYSPRFCSANRYYNAIVQIWLRDFLCAFVDWQEFAEVLAKTGGIPIGAEEVIVWFNTKRAAAGW